MAEQVSHHIAKKLLPIMEAVSGPLQTLLNSRLLQLHDAAVALAKARQDALRVDGTIIGTGEADFTKGNTIYALNFQGKTFQLMDVPGIEGNESRYADLVKQSVAKAHLLFYVNGTNKKPEVATARKIREYLRRGTQVYAIVNVRGNADAYEFEEDRISLAQQGQAGEALKQTMEVLEATLNRDVLLGGACVQGLLGFSALAYNADRKHTTIHPSRDNDLVIQQRNYLRCFESSKAMLDYSQVNQLSYVLQSKLQTFKEDIIESNKTKVQELLLENVAALEEMHRRHSVFMARIGPEFDKCRKSVEQAVRSCERNSGAERRNFLDVFFNQVSSEARQAVEDRFGNGEVIEKEIRVLFNERYAQLNEKLALSLRQCLDDLQLELQEALKRLEQDVQRFDFETRMVHALDDGTPGFRMPDLDMGLGYKEWGGFAINVASYAFTGALIGTPIPGVGNVIGAVVGAVVGALIALLEVFSSREKRIRKAQSQLQEKIDQMRSEAMKRSVEVDVDLAGVFSEIGASALAQIDALYNGLRKPLSVIEHQVESMARVEKQLKGMVRGTVEAV